MKESSRRFVAGIVERMAKLAKDGPSPEPEYPFDEGDTVELIESGERFTVIEIAWQQDNLRWWEVLAADGTKPEIRETDLRLVEKAKVRK